MELHLYETFEWINTFHVTSLFFNDKTCSRNSSPLLADDLSLNQLGR